METSRSVEQLALQACLFYMYSSCCSGFIQLNGLIWIDVDCENKYPWMLHSFRFVFTFYVSSGLWPC